MGDKRFTLKDWQAIKQDIFNDFFDKHNEEHDLKEAMKISVTGAPPGYHVMGDGSLMSDSEMPQEQ